MRWSRDSFFSQISHSSDRSEHDIKYFFPQITRPWLGNHSCRSYCSRCQAQAFEDDHPTSVGSRFQCSVEDGDVEQWLQSSCPPASKTASHIECMWCVEGKAPLGPLKPGVEWKEALDWVHAHRHPSKHRVHATQWCQSTYSPPKVPPKK